eukprot:tig00000903_g5515.t1
MSAGFVSHAPPATARPRPPSLAEPQAGPSRACPSAPACSAVVFTYTRDTEVVVSWTVLPAVCSTGNRSKKQSRRRREDDDDGAEGAPSEMPPWLWWGVGGLGGLLALGATTGFKFGPSPDDNAPAITLSAFSVARHAYDEIIPLFQQKWLQETGQRIIFRRSYGGSSQQSRAVQDGLEADVVAYALGADITNLEKIGLVYAGWEKRAPNNAVFARSVACLLVRPGNPKGIHDWADLARDDVKVIFSSPKTSGVAQWCFLAMFAAFEQATGSQEEAVKMLGHVIVNAPILTRDGSEAREVFLEGEKGDVLVTYEAAAVASGMNGGSEPYVIPDVNVSIENVIAVVDRNAEKHGIREVADAFLKFCFTDPAQRVLAEHGFRPVSAAVAKNDSHAHPVVHSLKSVKDFGGWCAARDRFFIEGGIYDAAERWADHLRQEHRRHRFSSSSRPKPPLSPPPPAPPAPAATPARPALPLQEVDPPARPSRSARPGRSARRGAPSKS